MISSYFSSKPLYFLNINFCKQNIQFSEDVHFFNDDFYAQVKDKKLQKRFIFKYKLEENFFESSELGYPSLLDDNNEEEVSESKFVKLFKKFTNTI